MQKLCFNQTYYINCVLKTKKMMNKVTTLYK